ncbi:hypothetical protein lam_138 [Candidatus Liberibacter americanus str. Sao Paulo]|uniref:Tim44-like domain-containing protein n=1 Tax=Candidatus Liberibacter americanus str. Sao Paulo TaxID=1261131 RepID=U6B6Y9_9HYPH|nr:hypothetical protein lam_138 [Candidatus Liberibacter americanus str. Sao Paulo]
MDLGDFLTFLFLFIAIFVFLQLRSVLGKRTGHEKPFFGFSFTRKKFSSFPSKDNKWKIVSLEKEKNKTNVDDIDLVFPFGTKLNQSLRDIVAVCHNFNLKDFLTLAQDYYELIVVSFFDGNISNIEKLVDKKVYEDFSNSISKRKTDDNLVKSSLIGIDELKIISARIEDKNIYITTRIVGQFISCSYDKEGTLLPDKPEVFGKVVDVWTFMNVISADNSNWKLISTE